MDEATTIQPLQPNWTPQKPAMAQAPYETKEVLDGRALFKWHCGIRMHKVLVFKKTSDGIITNDGLFPHSWLCLVCDARTKNDNWW